MTTDPEIRHHVYSATVSNGRPPRSSELAASLDVSQREVLEGFQRLFARRLLYLAPDSGEIVMAPPFSAVPTPFLVTVDGTRYFANCVWDAYGIAAALHADTTVEASCGCCGDLMQLEVRDGEPRQAPGVAHFAVPAAHWWNDLPYT